MLNLTWKIFFDNFDQFGTVTRLRDNAMAGLNSD
jgi:hypothetical protein